jgi:anti-sigma regulatory factor (Ser/Thr protein kinase)
MVIPFEARYPGTSQAVGVLRRDMAELAKDCGMDAEGIADVRLAVTEAATNAVVHAYAEAEGELSVTAAMHDGELTIVIGDTGSGLVERQDSPGLGVGLALIAKVVERLKIVSHPGSTEIHLAFPCPNAG